MKEIKCPHCGKVFTVNEEDYASIANQVKNSEFNEELSRRIEEMHQKAQAQQEVDTLKMTQNFNQKLAGKDSDIQTKQQEIDRLKEQLKSIEATHQLKLDAELAKAKAAQEAALAEKNQEISELNNKISNSENDKKMALMQEKNENSEALRAKENQIFELENKVKTEQNSALEKVQNLKNEYELKLNTAKEEIERIKDFKARLSTKMIGESLEQHCSNEFNKVRVSMYPHAYFEKDNDINDGTKGDFIFRDYSDNQEYISIMFEMKNECDTTSTKHKNEDFFAKLDKDRTSKKCEYAVLVSMLEPENELYNEGIVDVSYRYPKMFVIRPQFFMPLIALLSQASRKSIEYIRELEIARSQSIDVTNFEEKVAKFRDAFGRNVSLAVKNHEEAIGKIDAAIKGLQAIKTLFEKSNTYLTRADQQLGEDFTVRKLTYKNPTMKAKFEELK